MENSENGRSMVEMLGVLAIIGVLSAGALKGYSAAMFRYKMNKTIETFQLVLQRFAELEQKGWGKDIELGDTEDLIKYGLLDECQDERDEGSGYCRLPIGTFSMDVIDSSDQGLKGHFSVDFTDSKSCVAFASAGWENAVPQEWWIPCEGCTGGWLAAGSKYIYDPFGFSGEVKTKVMMQDIVEGCKECDIYTCRVLLEIREDF